MPGPIYKKIKPLPFQLQIPAPAARADNAAAATAGIPKYAAIAAIAAPPAIIFWSLIA
ncbi:hypothetical protein [Bacillus thuringiensis]|uniref:hypothetical protein n=1 Tax=Bacillus thuringiensis TaxID=1428 RepID=UPI00210B66DA|nr:hypothetical protein [Bacillus thuringiensis]